MPLQERQIVHVDMDAFYASVEIRDNPWLRGQPVIVGGLSNRGVVCAASYEAREYGVHSAMPTRTARRLCPHATFLKTRINYYREISRQIRRILEEYTDLIEPLSLDECYLDATENRKGLPTGFEVARSIKGDIRERLMLTASAGVGPCKLLAKIASDLEKPDGLVVVRADEAEAFLAPMDVGRLPGVGKTNRARLGGMGIHTVGQLAEMPRGELEQLFGRWGGRLWEYAHGVDPRPVSPTQETKSVSREHTFDEDTTDVVLLRRHLSEQAEAVARRLAAKGVRARTVTLKIKYADFTTATRHVTHESYFRDPAVVRDQALGLLRKTEAGIRPARLIGLGVSNFWRDDQAEQLSLFDFEAEEADHPSITDSAGAS